MSRLLLSIIVLACCLPIVAHGKTWRGIVPLRSTRADVERLLGPGNRGHYQFDEERAHVNYAEGECNPVNGCLCFVPKDTVISIHVQLEVEMSFSKLNIDKKNYEKFVSRKDPNLVTYSNDKEGIIYTVNEENDDVKAINYLPTAKDCQDVLKGAKRAGVKGQCRKAQCTCVYFPIELYVAKSDGCSPFHVQLSLLSTSASPLRGRRRLVVSWRHCVLDHADHTEHFIC